MLSIVIVIKIAISVCRVLQMQINANKRYKYCIYLHFALMGHRSGSSLNLSSSSSRGFDSEMNQSINRKGDMMKGSTRTNICS